jgi:hypothetical protein
MKKILMVKSNPTVSMWCEQCLHNILLSDGYEHCIADNQCFSDTTCPLEMHFMNYSKLKASLVGPIISNKT